MAFALMYNEQVYGRFGLISTELNNQFGIDQDVYISELNWDKLTQNSFSKNIQFEEVAKFPSVRRDFALLVGEEVTFNELEIVAFKTERKILTAVTLFDVYEGKNLPQGKKSYGINFTFQDKNKTLTDKQVDKIMDKLLKNFKEDFQAELR
jgi:phenylalanyl-tRNA synthetase beta chain